MIFTGRTVEEALLNAEKETGKERTGIIYTVSERKTGLFGSKEIVLEIQGFKESGKLEVKKGQLVYYPGDIPPTITPSENVIIRVNDSVILSKTSIRENDYTTIDTLNTSSSRSIDISISEDRLTAYIEIVYNSEKAYQIIDVGPGSDITVEAKCISEKNPDAYSKKDIEDLLELHKIKYGIKWENIPGILRGGKHIIAKGLSPKEPQDDEIKYLFRNLSENKPLEINGKVDYLSIGKVDTVDAGTILAVRIEGEDGRPGYDVYGNVIQAPKKKTSKFKKGPGSELLDNGNRIIASIKGMVSVKNDTICVFPVHTINGDVDIKTGNIQFDGDIVVAGNVREGLKINAGNNITIYGNVAEASISSGGNIKIEKNVISSTLNAGSKQMDDFKSMEYLRGFEEFLDSIINAYYDITKLGRLPGGAGLGSLFKVLLQSKYKTQRDKIIEGMEFISKRPVSEDLKVIWNEGVKIFKAIEDGELNDIKNALSTNNTFKDFISKHDTISTPADVIINYSQNSNINATNNVEVKGKGCYNTNIIAANRVVFSGYPGVLRGGQVFGEKGITAKEVGSNAGVVTILRTSRDGIIEANVVYQNTVVCIGEQSYRIDNPVKTLKAYLQKGEIVVEKLKLI